MLFLLRPRQTYMPYALPRDQMDRETYDQQLQEAYASTRRVAPYEPNPKHSATPDLVADLRDLGALHESGALSDDEFAAAKSKLLAPADTS
jgi:hypothetical protein